MKFFACFVALITATAPVCSQDTRPYELASADKRLNAVYQRLLSQMDAPTQNKLKKAQRAWIAYRDLDCAWAYSSVPLDCLINRTEERITALEDTFFNDKAGNYTSVGAKKN